MSWSHAELERFTQGVIDALGDGGVSCEPVPGSLRVTLGGSTVAGGSVVVTWASTASGRLVQHRDASIPPAVMGDVLRRAADKLIEPPAAC